MAHLFSEEEYKKGIVALKNNKAAGRDDTGTGQATKASWSKKPIKGNAQRMMLHRKQDPQDMEKIQDYRHTQARERCRDSEELQANLPLMSYVQTLQKNDSKQNSHSS